MARMSTWQRTVVGWTVGAIAFFLMPALALAAKPTEPDREVIDARFESYAKNVTLDPGSVALTWFLLVVLGIVCLAVMFKDARRTHLD